MRQSRQLALAGLSAIAVAYGFARYGYGLFLPEIRGEFGLSVEVLGLIASSSYVGYLLALSIVGILAARVGPRPLVVAGGLSAALGMALIALAPNTAVLVVGVTLAGTSSGWCWAPYSDAVVRMVPPRARGRILSIISTGTTFGIIVAAPIALAASASWRGVWLLFAASALAATAWNAWILPGGPHRASQESSIRSLGFGWFLRKESAPLFVAAFSYGLVGAVYWSFAVDLIASADPSPAARPVFWALVGIFGVTGVFTGDLISRFGLRRVFVAILAALALAIALLGAAPGSWPTICVSGALYGAGFMPMAALLAVWSSSVFAEQPSTGFSAVVFLLGLGTIVGPAALGAFAGSFGLGPAFLVTAALALLTVLARPGRKAQSAGPNPLAGDPPVEPQDKSSSERGEKKS